MRSSTSAMPIAEVFGDRLYRIGALTIVMLAITLLSLETGWWIGLTPGGWALLPSAALAGVLFWRVKPRQGAWLLGSTAAIFASAAVSAFWFATVRDYSWDGPAYHAPAVVKMLGGWNPTKGGTGMIWVDSYPHGIWALKALIAHLAGDSVEAGRALGVIAAMGIATMLYGSFTGLGPMMRTVVAVLVLANPIVLGQFMTDYVDWFVYLFSLALLIALMDLDGPRGRPAFFAALACMLLLVSTKTSGLYYLFMVTAGASLWLCYKARYDRRMLLRRMALLAAFSGISLLLIGLACYRPYLTNVFEHGSLGYPSFDTALGVQIPANLIDAGPFKRFLYLLFSAAGSGTGEALSLHLLPSNGVVWGPDNRGAGFGELFWLQLLLGLSLAGSSLPRGVTPEGLRLGWMAVIFIAASLLFPVSWWARLVPLVWVASVFLATMPLAGQDQMRQPQAFSVVFAMFTAVCIWNAAPFAASSLAFAQTETERFETLAASLRTYREVALVGAQTNFFDVSYAQALKRKGVNVVEGPCAAGVAVTRLYGDQLTICQPD